MQLFIMILIVYISVSHIIDNKKADIVLYQIFNPIYMEKSFKFINKKY